MAELRALIQDSFSSGLTARKIRFGAYKRENSGQCQGPDSPRMFLLRPCPQQSHAASAAWARWAPWRRAGPADARRSACSPLQSTPAVPLKAQLPDPKPRDISTSQLLLPPSSLPQPSPGWVLNGDAAVLCRCCSHPVSACCTAEGAAFSMLYSISCTPRAEQV